MKFHCPGCQKKYRVDPVQIPAKGVQMRCRRCQTLMLITPDAVGLADPRVEASTDRPETLEMAPAEAFEPDSDANELIEQGKSRAIDPTHLEMFAALYGRLTAEETNAFYFALKPKRVQAHDVIFRQGEFVSHLFLIEKGRLKLVFNDPRSQKEMFLKALYPGDVTNVEAFLSFTGNTVSLMADSDATLAYLDKEVISRWEEAFPDLETKLSEHLHKQENIRNMVKKAGLNIRAHQRVKTDLKVLMQMSSSKGQPQRAPFAVNLQDISLGGLCYEMRLEKKQEAAKLLGQRLTIQAEFPGPKGSNEFRRRGKIVAVRIQPFGASTVHVQFDKLLDKNTVIDISQHRPAGGPS